MTKTIDAKSMSESRDRMIVDLTTNEDGSVCWVWESPHGVALVGIADSEQAALEAAVNAHAEWYERMH